MLSPRGFACFRAPRPALIPALALALGLVASALALSAPTAASAGGDGARTRARTRAWTWTWAGPSERPGPPTEVVVRAGNGRATLEWTAPVDAEGDADAAPIQGYVVTPVVRGAARKRVRFASTSTTQAVEGLRNGRDYRFTVAAYSAAGVGEPSSLTDAVTPTVPPTGTDGTIDIIGDSITVQATSNRADEFAAQGQPEGADLVTVAVAGSRFGDHRPGEHDRVWRQSRPSVLVVALGTNDANALADGWTGADEVAFGELIDTPSPSTCVVVVLPAVGAQAGDAQLEQFARARSAMRSIAGERNRTVIADWGAVIAEHPEYLFRDGVHLSLDGKASDQLASPDAADAFAANLWAGVHDCPA